MKKKNFSTLVKKSLIGLSLTGLLLAGFSSAFAQGPDNPSDPVVKYVGSLDGQPVFKVELNNEDAQARYLTIKDDEGTVLYSEKIRDKQFSKKFRFDNADRDNVKLTFIIEGNNGIQSKEFKVNTSTRVLNDVVVTSVR
jgi:hypothetical protein